MQEQFREVQVVDLSEVKPYDNNPRNNEGAVDDLARIIEANGFLVPLIVDKNMVLVTGHTRRLAMLKLGMTKAQVIVADHLSDQQVAAFRLADNRVSENSKWDENKLADELRQLSDMGFDLSFTGFSKEELDCLCGSIDASCLDDMDYETICGEVAPKVVASKTTIVVSVGNYRFYVSVEEYKAWESDLLSKFPKRNDLVNEIGQRLGFMTAKTEETVLAEEAAQEEAE